MTFKSLSSLLALSAALAGFSLAAKADTLATANPNYSLPICQIKNNCPPPSIPVNPPQQQPTGPKGPKINLNFGLGYGDSYDGYDGISCGEGRNILRHRGFKHVHAMDCSGDIYAYSAIKRGRAVEVEVNSNGRIISVGAL
jgi:hypothetical protein